MYQYKATCTRVIDGDTIELVVELGFYVKTIIRGRLVGYDAAELFSGTNRELALEHKLYLESLVLNKKLIVETYKDKQSFNRWLVIVSHDKININEVMQKYINGVQSL